MEAEIAVKDDGGGGDTQEAHRLEWSYQLLVY